MFVSVLDTIKKHWLVLGLCLCLVVVSSGLGILLLTKPSDQSPNTLDEALLLADESSSQTSHQPEEDVSVDVKGAIKKEGVYRLKKGSRVIDLIEQAGGFTESADKRSVNLAQKLTDEAVIYVASQGENISVVTSQNGQPSSANAKLNLNRASLEELQNLSGIGQKRAQDIIDYRDRQGGFQSLDDLLKVSGIGQKTLERLKEELTLD